MNMASVREEAGITADAFDGSKELMDRARALVSGPDLPTRVDTIDDSMSWASCAPLTKVPTANGLEPMAPERVMRLRMLLGNTPRWQSYCQIVNPNRPVLDLMSIGYVFSRTQVSEPLLSQSGIVKEAELPWRQAYRNPTALPRFFLVHRVRNVSGPEQAAAILRSGGFDPHLEALVEGPVRLPPNLPIEEKFQDRITVLEYSPRRVVLDVDASSAAWLATSETHYPGWRASVDGREEQIHYTNLAFRGLAVAAGRHRIEFDFSPDVLSRGAAISAISWALLAACLFKRRTPKSSAVEREDLAVLPR
jgi:hypothetical protein